MFRASRKEVTDNMDSLPTMPVWVGEAFPHGLVCLNARSSNDGTVLGSFGTSRGWSLTGDLNHLGIASRVTGQLYLLYGLCFQFR